MLNGIELYKRTFFLIDCFRVLLRSNIEAVTEGKYQRVYQETGHTRAGVAAAVVLSYSYMLSCFSN